MKTTRIIPARAGFTPPPGAPIVGPGDHPRSRGVYVHPAGAPPLIVGSSPLARGLPHGRPALARGAGIIPARAGFTLLVPDGLPQDGDHPRSRGVYGGSMAVTRPPTGSSPLARGLHHTKEIR